MHLVDFERVSKIYNLGLTRTSLPNVITKLFRGEVFPARDTLVALKDVSFQLESGDSLALIGRNGAGKTTILKLLANITMPTEGMISVMGRLSALIELGAGFHPDLTGRENIFLNGAILGLRRDEVKSRFNEIVEFAELARFIDTPIKRYSSGMNVRLGFAVAACVEPQILLVDEVLAVGDASFRQKCIHRIEELIKKGTSIIFVSHNLYMVQAVCQSALYLRDGQIEFAGKTEDAIRAYERDLHRDRAERFMTSSRAAPVAGEGVPVEVTGIELFSLGSRPTETLRSWERARIEICYLAYEDLGRVNLAVFFIRSDGLSVSMMRTKVDGFEFEVRQGGGQITLCLDSLQLATGEYFVEVEFTNAADSMVLRPSPTRSSWFSVEGRTRNYNDRSGVFEQKVVWEHTTETMRKGSNSAEATELLRKKRRAAQP